MRQWQHCESAKVDRVDVELEEQTGLLVSVAAAAIFTMEAAMTPGWRWQAPYFERVIARVSGFGASGCEGGPVMVSASAYSALRWREPAKLRSRYGSELALVKILWA